ncbi:MAG TPA: hypothetical protein VK176_10640 [Phycisphaerales bacterium]|nr:hypothetical protein [Phycisphaerales bacterium]
MDMPAGDATRGSTSSRLLGATALTVAATLCAVGGVITTLFFVYALVESLADRVAALAALAGTFGLMALTGWLVARSMARAAARRAQLERALKELEERRRAAENRRELEARREEDPEPDSLTEALAAAAGLPQVGPWLRVAGAAAPVLGALVALVGPVRLARIGVRGYAAWRTYQKMQQATTPAQEEEVHARS